MKLDPDLRLRILEMIGIYSRRLSILEPAALLSTREVLDAPRQLTRGRRSTAYRYYGVAYLRGNMIFVNVKKIPDPQMLEETVVHELVHMRFPYLSHGRRFDEMVRRAKRGESFGPYRRRGRPRAGWRGCAAVLPRGRGGAGKSMLYPAGFCSPA